MFKQVFLAAIFASLSPVTELADDETLIFYPASVRHNSPRECRVTITGRVYEKEEESLLRKLFINKLAKELALTSADRRSFRLQARVRDFLADNERGKEIRINIGGSSYHLGESGPGGHFSKTLRLPATFCQKAVKRPCEKKYHAVLPKNDNRKFDGTVICIPEEGISVISDIDDTIKISNVLNRKEMLANTFLKAFRPVSGMARWYRGWQRRGAAFHYVSGSPWQLYGALSGFMKRENFPPGSFSMKKFRVKDRSFFSFLSGNQRAYKIGVISGIIQSFKKRHFILVGDSGESDPEVYCAVAARFPKQVRAIYIRDAGNLKERKKDIMKLFRALPGVKTRFFKKGSQLPLNI